MELKTIGIFFPGELQFRPKIRRKIQRIPEKEPKLRNLTRKSCKNRQIFHQNVDLGPNFDQKSQKNKNFYGGTPVFFLQILEFSPGFPGKNLCFLIKIGPNFIILPIFTLYFFPCNSICSVL